MLKAKSLTQKSIQKSIIVTNKSQGQGYYHKNSWTKFSSLCISFLRIHVSYYEKKNQHSIMYRLPQTWYTYDKQRMFNGSKNGSK